jgi:Predicted methyltransferases
MQRNDELHEAVISDKLSNIIDKIKKEKIYIKGEIVIVIEGATNVKNNLKIDTQAKKEFLKRLSASESAKLISLITKQNKRDIYKFLIET